MDILNIIFKASSALLLAVIWAAYLRKVDIFQPENWYKVLISFLLGCATVLPVFYWDLPDLIQSNKPTFFNMLVYYSWNVGLMEEISKFSAFLVLFVVLRKWFFQETPNYIIHASIIALGFATVENFTYFQNYGVDLVYMRGMMSTFTHMVGTSIVAAFFYFGQKRGWYWILPYTVAGLVIAGIEHGLYDTFLSFQFTGSEPIFLKIGSLAIYKLANVLFYLSGIAIYMIGIEVYCTLLNNFSNMSPLFDPGKFIDRKFLTRMLLVSFITAGVVQVIGLLDRYGFSGIQDNMVILIMELVFTIVLVTRITRFTFIRGKWFPIYPKLPFVYRTITIFNPYELKKERFSYFTIRGDEFNEYPYTKNLHYRVFLIPLMAHKSLVGQSFYARMAEKIYIGNEIMYRMELTETEFTFEGRHPLEFILKPKVMGTHHIDNQPIAALMLLPHTGYHEGMKTAELQFVEWVVLESVDAAKKQKRNFFREFFA